MLFSQIKCRVARLSPALIGVAYIIVREVLWIASLAHVCKGIDGYRGWPRAN